MKSEMKIELRALIQDGEFIGLLVPVGMSPANNLVELDEQHAIVNCLVLDGYSHMYPTSLTVRRFKKCPLRILEMVDHGEKQETRAEERQAGQVHDRQA